MASILVPIVDDEGSAVEEGLTESHFVRERFAYGLTPDQITRELVQRGHSPREAHAAVEAVRRDRYRRV